MEFAYGTPVQKAAERLRNEDNLQAVQSYLVALIEFLEAEQMNHELNLTRAFREVVIQTDALINQ